jgi:acyl-CoA synthetase (AMP-forming)/AMP-acid ligase II
MSATHENTLINSKDDHGFSTSDDVDADKMSALQKVLQLEKELKAVVAKGMGKPLTPSRIHVVSALPKTRNAKVMRRVIRSAYLGEDVGDVSALEDPKTVEEIKSIDR